MRYVIYFDGEIPIVETNNLEEALRYAQFNAAAVFDRDGWMTIVDYREG